jgi:hypothetical protein
MKLPFEFGIKLLFRLVLPGAVLAAALAPAVHGVLHWLGVWIKIQYLFPFEVVYWGWAIVLCDMRIYMLFEGRRYWPCRLKKMLMLHQERRLKKLKGIMDAGPGDDRRRYLEAGVEHRLYPLDASGNVHVVHPTRLGNIIEAFETYPWRKYGIDAIFYWPRLWVVLDKDLREEIDTAQSVVDSALYTAFAFYLCGVMMIIYGVIGFFPKIQLPYVPPPFALFASGICSMVIGFSIYYLTLPAHAQFGTLFESVFDQYRAKLVFVDDVIKEVSEIVGAPTLLSRSQSDKYRIAWRYLQWHRIRDEAANKNLTVAQWKEFLNTLNPPNPGNANETSG